MRKLELLGISKGRLTVLEERGKEVYCRCICGNTKWVFRTNFLAGYTQSCGCLRNEKISEANTTHGKTGLAIHWCWKAMKRRCYNPNHRAYKWYGGRGIRVCEEWLKFENFYRDMKDGYKKGLTLDRIDHNGNYTKENCRWLTKSDNSKRDSYVQAF
jgi:hypothetical protein